MLDIDEDFDETINYHTLKAYIDRIHPRQIVEDDNK